MDKKTLNPDPQSSEAAQPTIPQPPTDGFPAGKDVSIPPSESDQGEEERSQKNGL